MKKPQRWIAPAADKEFPLDSPSPPPRRICIICGTKYLKLPGEPSRCGHINADGSTINPEPPSWRPTNKKPVQ